MSGLQESELSGAIVEQSPLDFQDASGFPLVASRFPQRSSEHVFFDAAQDFPVPFVMGHGACPISGSLHAGRLQIDAFRGNDAAWGNHHRPFDDVLQFANIARLAVRQQ